MVILVEIVFINKVLCDLYQNGSKNDSHIINWVSMSNVFLFLFFSENICDLLKGELCAHICVSSPGSYKCECHEGFTLMADGKTCHQATFVNRLVYKPIY